jgi:hypothetical protein
MPIYVVRVPKKASLNKLRIYQELTSPNVAEYGKYSIFGDGVAFRGDGGPV